MVKTLFVGVVAMLGVMVIVEGAVAHVIGVQPSFWDFIAYPLGAALGGGILVGTGVCASWKPAFVTAVLAVGVKLALYALLMRGWYSFAPIHTERAIAIGAVAGVGAIVGAVVFAPAARIRTLGALGLGALITTGAAPLVINVLQYTHLPLLALLFATIGLSLFASGYLTQAIIGVDRVWTCALAGPLALVGWAIAIEGKNLEASALVMIAALSSMSLLGAWLAARGRTHWGVSALPIF